MKINLAFDVHGTLVDAAGVLTPLKELAGEKAEEILQTWKYKQREYAFRRRLMEDYVDFSVCSQQALDYACLFHKIPLTDAEKKYIMEFSKALPAFPEAKEALQSLKSKGFRLFAFSNGPLTEVKQMLERAGLAPVFNKIFSVENTRTFKPDPAVYEYFLRHSHAGHQFTWFISGNSFDVIGAKNVSLKVIWVQRNPDHIMDPWGIAPDKTVKDLAEVVDFFDSDAFRDSF